MFGRRKSGIGEVPSGPLTELALRNWLIGHLATRVDIPAAEIDPTRTFEEYGLDSRVAIQVTGALEKVVERRLSPSLLYDFQSIDALAGHLARELNLAPTA